MGSAIGSLTDTTVYTRARKIAFDRGLRKCKTWINSRTCPAICSRKNSRTEIASTSGSIDSSNGRIRAMVKLKLKAIVDCKNQVMRTKKK